MIDIKEYKITPLNAMCQLVNQELMIIKRDLVEAGIDNEQTLEVITGAEIDDYYINTGHELYAKFKNGDVLKATYC